MRIHIIGGGPAGLYFALLMKQQDPLSDIQVFERNRPDDTFGWGVVFSRETLGNLGEADPESYADITANFRYWDDIHILYKGSCIRSTGHGFCGMSRKKLLNILQERCTQLGVRIAYQHEVDVLDPYLEADLVIAADGVNSKVRADYAAIFQPSLDWRKCRFTWLGTDLPLEAFKFIFRQNEHGLFQVHAYPFEPDLGTFIVECREEVWRRAGLDQAGEADTVAYCEALFADVLHGHKLLTNRSLWRSFPTVRCATWHHRNIVLLGDAAHTAHFSIGSGTKLAMEDAIALAEVFRAKGTADVATALATYEEERWLEVLKLQRAAQVSLEWFEHADRYMDQAPQQFAFNLLSRSKRITYDNLRVRDPEYVRQVDAWYARDQGWVPAGEEKGGTPVKHSDGSASVAGTDVAATAAHIDYMPSNADFLPSSPDTAAIAPPPMFIPFRLRDLTLPNRVVVSAMCQYSAVDGMPNDWTLVHLGSRAVGGAGLVMTEMTDVSREGRISPGCAGMYLPGHVLAWRRIVDFVHDYTPAKIGLQLAHAGRKASTCLGWDGYDEPLPNAADNWPIMSASPIPYFPHSQVPREMNRTDMDEVVADFARAARMGDEAGFDLLEVHMAHGYLLSCFISPLTNIRTDEYGGALPDRMRFPLEVFDAVRAAWPAHKPMSVRISATDWVADGGLSGDDAVAVARLLKAHGCDIVDVSAGQTTTRARPIYGRMYQVPFSDQIRHEAHIPTMAVGNIQGPDHINTVLAAGRADLCALARPHLKDPYLTLHAAEEYGYDEQWWPNPYLAVKPKGRGA